MHYLSPNLTAFNSIPLSTYRKSVTEVAGTYRRINHHLCPQGAGGLREETHFLGYEPPALFM